MHVCRFPRQLTIYPGHSGYSSLQCGLPPPFDCGVLFDRQRFGDRTGGGTLSFARFSSAALKTDDQPSSSPYLPRYDYNISFDMAHVQPPQPPRSGDSDSQPTGNGFQANNVWLVPSAGAILFTVDRGEAYDAFHGKYKLGRVRITTQPNMLSGCEL